ncbi:DUF6327 family protein [Flavobacterium rhizosphaerae]|uniref:DUF6327 family protein n=1 Tax=Flavobacterium rhizosphaerae TaxID=3163298 RepID=A0ABW8YYI5_9FLAO
MSDIVYKSYNEIEREIEIARVERDLAFAKFQKSFDDTKESLQPENIIGDTPKKIFKILGAFSGPIKSAALTFLFKKIF